MLRGLALVGIAVCSGCVAMAAPPPVATLGGPETAAPGHAEVALGMGGGASLFPGAHSGGQGLFGRYRRGVAENVDVGADVLAGQHGQYVFVTTKLAARFRAAEHLRIEVGMGAADDSLGKSLNGDIAAVVGTARTDRVWNYYAAARALGAKGFRGDLGSGNVNPDDQTTIAPADALVGVFTLGTSARTSQNGRIAFEGGVGPEFVRGEKNVGIAFYFGGAMLFDIGPDLPAACAP
jgi:hypothetical protein